MNSKLFISLISLLITSQLARAQEYYHSGYVEDLLIRTTLDSYAIVYIEDFTDAGTCNKYDHKDRVILSLKGEKAEAMYTTLLAAYLSSKSVKVAVNDTVVDGNGNCLLKDVRLNASF